MLNEKNVDLGYYYVLYFVRWLPARRNKGAQPIIVATIVLDKFIVSIRRGWMHVLKKAIATSASLQNDVARLYAEI